MIRERIDFSEYDLSKIDINALDKYERGDLFQNIRDGKVDRSILSKMNLGQLDYKELAIITQLRNPHPELVRDDYEDEIDERVDQVESTLSKIHLSGILKILANILLVPIKILCLPIIALSFFLSIALEMAGGLVKGIVGIFGGIIILAGIFMIIDDPAQRTQNIIGTVGLSIVFGMIYFALEVIPQAFAVISGSLIALLKFWF